jgi:N4-gp56 family major capsid protein
MKEMKQRLSMLTTAISAVTSVFAPRKVYADFMNTISNNGTATPGNAPLDNGATAVVLTNNLRVVYSKEIEFKAQPIMRFAQFARVKTELGTQPGLEIQMMTYNNIKRGGKLTEGVKIKAQAMSSTMKGIKVGERGNAISITELALKTSFTDAMADATRLLAMDMALVLDTELRDTALDKAINVIYGRATNTSPKITSRANIGADNYLSVASIKDAVEILATNNTPKFDGNYYICFVHPHQSRMLRDDSAWLEASKYGAPDQLFTGEIGRIDDVRFIETTLMCNGAVGTDDDAYKADLVKGAPGAPANFNVYQSIVFGEDYYAYAVGLPVELRDNGVEDYGREHGLAWYAIWGADLLNPERAVRIETC